MPLFRNNNAARSKGRRKTMRRTIALLATSILSITLLTPTPAHAVVCCIANVDAACDPDSCRRALDVIDDFHNLDNPDSSPDQHRMGPHLRDEFINDLARFEDWMIEVLLGDEVAPALSAMATQMNAVAMQYTQAIGAFLDAQNQMETQRLLRELQFNAHKDYTPSQSFCKFGTNVRSLAASGRKGDLNALTLARISLARQIGTKNAAPSGTLSLGLGGDLSQSSTPAAESPQKDLLTRWHQFTENYCDRRDNNWQVAGSTGLELACDHDGPAGSSDVGARDPNRINRDIDFTRLIDAPRTLDLDFEHVSTANSILGRGTLNSTNPNITGTIPQPHDEMDVLAMSRNLYGHNVLPRNFTLKNVTDPKAITVFVALRSIVAKRGVAQASFNALVGLKSSGSYNDPDDFTNDEFPHSPSNRTFNTDGTITDIASNSADFTNINVEDHQTRRFLGAIMAELLPARPNSQAGNIFELIGHYPSYYAQLEILAKRIYQNPDFYAGLYESPTNVARKNVALKAIELMVDREIYESQLRREMNLSVLLATSLRAEHRLANRKVAEARGLK